jgi:hypothetical protein
MTERTRVRVAVVMWAVSVAAAMVALGLLFAGVNTVVYIAGVTLTFSTVGVLVVRAQPRNRIGWILLAIGACYAYLVLGAEYGTAALAQHWPLPPRVTLWVALWIWGPALGTTATYLFLLFPDGHLPSPRWRWVAWLSGIAIATATVGYAVAAARVVFPAGPRAFVALVRTGNIDVHAPVFEVGVLLAAVCMVASVVAAVMRLRRSTGREHEQLQWFVYGTVALAVGVVGSFGQNSIVLPHLGFAAFVACIAVAMLRHRLYDIDRIVNRTLVYGVVTILLGSVYGALAVGLGSVLGSNANSLVIAGATLVVAALFRPVRRRIQAFIDRRFYRRKYDAALTLEQFTARLREEVDLDDLEVHLLDVVRDTLQPAQATLWLRTAEAAR